MRRRLLPGLLAVVTAGAALSGCAGLGTTAASPAATTPTTPASPLQIKTVTVAVPKPRTPAPALAITSTAWPKVLASLTAYGQWLLANPNPALVGNIATPGCAVAQLLSTQVQSLIDSNTYVVTTPPTFSAITGSAPASGQEVLMITAGRPAEPVVSRAQKLVTIGSYDAVPPASFEVTLDQGADGKWRYCTIENQPDETVAAVPLL
jgi:hypothetical protein